MTDMTREKGSEDGTTQCPTCGATLELAVRPDGSVASEPCDACTKDSAKGVEPKGETSPPAPPAPPAPGGNPPPANDGAGDGPGEDS